MILTSPEDYSIGNASVTSAYSYYWLLLLERAIADIDINLGAPEQNEIDELDRQIAELRKNYLRLRLELEDLWTKYATSIGTTPATDKYYIFKKKRFADDLGYPTQLAGARRDISIRLTKQNQIRLKFNQEEEARILISTYQYASFEEYEFVLPIIPDFERNDGLTAADLVSLAVNGSAGYFESGMDVRPVGDLRNFFANQSGKNLITIAVDQSYQHHHDSDWSVSASGRWSWFSASVSSGNESHIRESLDKVRKIDVGWANMANYPVRRGRWFNLDILGYKRIQEIFKNDPRLKAQLSRTVASLVLARGLSITLEFSDASSIEKWEKSTFSGSAGVNVFGIGFGGGGSSYEYDWSLEKDGAKQTVTLVDDPRYARICAFVSEEVIEGLSQQELVEEFADPSLWSSEIIKELSQ